MAQADNNPVYISLGRRLIAAMLDLFIITAVFFPLMHIVNMFIYGDRTIEVIMMELSNKTDDNISTNLVLTTLASENYFSKYILSQSILFISIGFYTVFFWHSYGATPGKFLLNCKVVDAKTQKNLSIKQCVVRFAGYILSSIPLFIGFFMVDFNQHRKGIHDRISGSIVIADNRILSMLKSLGARFSWK